MKKILYWPVIFVPALLGSLFLSNSQHEIAKWSGLTLFLILCIDVLLRASSWLEGKETAREVEE